MSQKWVGSDQRTMQSEDASNKGSPTKSREGGLAKSCETIPKGKRQG